TTLFNWASSSLLSFKTNRGATNEGRHQGHVGERFCSLPSATGPNNGQREPVLGGEQVITRLMRVALPGRIIKALATRPPLLCVTRLNRSAYVSCLMESSSRVRLSAPSENVALFVSYPTV